MLRLFVAVTLPRDALRACGEECERVRQALGKLARAIKLPRREGLHFTLKFLGWAPEDAVDAIEQGLARAAAQSSPFDLTIEGFQAFPSPRRPRVVYLSVTEGRAEMSALAAHVEAEISPLGFPPEERLFTPHVTLLRVKDPKASARIGEAVAALQKGPPIRFRVERVVLMRSQLHPAGSIYTPLADIPLGG